MAIDSLAGCRVPGGRGRGVPKRCVLAMTRERLLARSPWLWARSCCTYWHRRRRMPGPGLCTACGSRRSSFPRSKKVEMTRARIVALVLALTVGITVIDSALVATPEAAATTTATTTSTTSTRSTTRSRLASVCAVTTPRPELATYEKIPAGTAGAVLGGSLANIGKQNSI